MSAEVPGTPRPLRDVFSGAAGRTPAARLGVAVVKDLVAAIVTGEFRPGDTLPPEAPLSEHFGVSRTVIRESVKRVEEKGLLTVAQGRGTTVNPATEWNVLDPVVLSALVDHDDALGVLDELTIVRASLEASMASAAASRQTPELSAELGQAYQETVARIGDIEAYNEADAKFHYAIMDQSGNLLAANITRILFTRARESSRFIGELAPDSLLATVDEHKAILDAIIAGDEDGAARRMYAHISQAWARRRPKSAPGT